MSIAWYNVTALAPELATTIPATQTALLAYVNAKIDDDTWGDTLSADMGRAYYAAHLATLAKRRGSGPITQEAVGQLSRSYGPTGVPGALGMTSYGAMYELLARQTVAVLGIVP